MAAHYYYDLRIEIISQPGKKMVATCYWEDNDYVGALKHPEIKKKLELISNGLELIQAIEQAYKDENNRLTPIEILREGTVDWFDDDLALIEDFKNVIQINLAEETHDLFGGGRPTKKYMKLTYRQNSNLKKVDRPKPSPSQTIELEGTETVTLKLLGGTLTAERSIKDSKRKKVYGRTIAEICEVLSCATKITANLELVREALGACLPDVQRLVSLRYLTAKLELPNDAKNEIDKVIKKHHTKILVMLISEKHPGGVQYVLSICKRIKPEDINALITMSKQLETHDITECLYDYMKRSE